MKLEKPAEKVATHRVEIHHSFDEHDFNRDEIDLGEDGHSFQRVDFMSNPKAHDEMKDDDVELDDDHLVKNLGFEPDFSEPIQHMGNMKMQEADHFGNHDFAMKNLNDPIGDFSHHSDLYNDDFIDIAHFND